MVYHFQGYQKQLCSDGDGEYKTGLVEGVVNFDFGSVPQGSELA